MINAVLETLRKIVRDPVSGVGVAIIPEMRMASGDGVIIENAGFKLP